VADVVDDECFGGCLCFLLLFEALYLDISSPAITIPFGVHLLVIMVVVVGVDLAHRTEVVAVATGRLFALETARGAGSDRARCGVRGGHGGKGAGERERGARGGLGEHGEGAGAGARGRVSSHGGDEGLGNRMEFRGGVERGHG